MGLVCPQCWLPLLYMNILSSMTLQTHKGRRTEGDVIEMLETLRGFDCVGGEEDYFSSPLALQFSAPRSLPHTGNTKTQEQYVLPLECGESVDQFAEGGCER